MLFYSGYQVIQASNAFSYEESAVAEHEEFQRIIRVSCQAFNAHRLFWPPLRKVDKITLYKYIAHKLIRWFTICPLAALLFPSATMHFAVWRSLRGEHYQTTAPLASVRK